MQSKIFAATFLALVSTTLAQSGMTAKPSTTASVSGAEVVTMMWDNEPTAAAGSSISSDMSGMSMDASMTMSNGEVMSGMSGTSMTTATGTAMAGMNMTGSAGRAELGSGAAGAGWVLISLGAGVGFLAGML